MKNSNGLPQFLLRLTLAIGFILPVMDRLGFLGALGTGTAAWGNWDNFIIYTNRLLPFLSKPVANIVGTMATVAEIVFGICLLIGFKTRLMALGSALLTLLFGIAMAISLGIQAPFTYPVFVFTGGAWLLSKVENYKWSVDNLM